jgi:2-iminobutanoate/2-iminopropanoate deaminase
MSPLGSSDKRRREAADEGIRTVEVGWEAGGHYSQAIAAAGLLFIAGQTAGVPGSEELAAMDVSQQTAACIDRIKRVVEQEGGTLANVVKTTCFLRDIGDFAGFNAAYAEAFGSNAPTRSTIQVGAFPEGLLVEIEAMAVVGH